MRSYVSTYFRNLILGLVFVFSFSGESSASHILGGEISFKCVAATSGPGRYEFTVVVFRDCNGIPLDIAALQLQMQPVAGQPNISQVLPRVLSQDVTLRCATATGFSCDPPTSANGVEGSVAKFVYRGIVDLSGLAAAPPGGYVFYVTTGAGGNTLPCCRPTINNSLASNGNQSLQVKMFRYLDPATGVALTPAQMCDDSPVFSNDPTALLVINPNDTVFYQNFAIDPNNSDSTSFDIDYPLNQGLTPYFYTPPYSLTNPLPGLLGPGVVGAANHPINPVSGEMVLRPNQTGTFVTVIKVISYRCGQKIAEVFRDFSLKIIPLPAGYPPVFNPNTPSTNPSYFYQQRPPQIRSELKDAAGNDVFNYRFYAKDTISLYLRVEDILPIFSGNPANYPNSPAAPQGFYTVFNSSQIGAGNNPQACNFPPCMTLRGPNDPPLPAPAITIPTTQFLYPGGPVIGTGFDQSGFTQGGGQISWIPDCSNLPSQAITLCGTSVTGYKVDVSATDLICPVPGRTSRVVTFNILNLPQLVAPRLLGVSAASDNASVRLHFSQFVDTVTIDPVDSFYFQANSDVQFKRRKSAERRKRSFVSYRMYRASVPAGQPLIRTGPTATPFAPVGDGYVLDSVSITDNDPTLDLLNNDYYYYLVNTSTCDSIESLPSDTLKVMRVRVTNLQPAQIGMGVAWDTMTVLQGIPYPTYSNGDFVVEREFFFRTPGVWQALDTIRGWNYADLAMNCTDSINYRVGLLTSLGFTLYSSVDGDNFNNNYQPPAVTVLHASVDSLSGNAVLSWLPGDCNAIDRYIIYRYLGPGSWQPLDTVFGCLNTWWEDVVSGQNPNDSSLIYGVASVDSCRNVGLVSRQHATIFMTGMIDECRESMNLMFTGYDGFPVGRYEIWRSGAGMPAFRVGTVAGGQVFYGYEDRFDLMRDSTYCYTILAFRPTGTPNSDTIAWSNVVCLTANWITPTEVTYIRKVSVNPLTNQIELLYWIDSDADIDSVVLQRSTGNPDTYRDIRRLPIFALIPDPTGLYRELRYTDPTADPLTDIYYYRVKLIDFCGRESDSSAVARSIWLRAKAEADFNTQIRNLVEWNSYDSWLGGVERYELLFNVPGRTAGFIPLSTEPSVAREFAHDIIGSEGVPGEYTTNHDGQFQYRLVAIELPGNDLGTRDTVFSNQANMLQYPRLFVPTGFRPDGFSPVFRPTGVYVDTTKSYDMEIFDRWGALMFRTNSYAEGWDGKIQGSKELAPPGVYAFTLNFTGRNGKPYQRQGTFTVVR